MRTNRTLSIIAFLLITSPLLAANYYWVGGTGTWSDFATHWATTSGGTVFHVTIPSPNDDVFFDANSFPSVNDTVYMDTTLTNCRSMDWSGITNAPTWFGTLNLAIYGSFTLDPNMLWKANGTITFQSNTIGNVINSNGVALADTAHFIFCNLIFSGTGSWDLANELNTGNDLFYGSITVSGGSLYTHGYFVIGSSVTTINTANLYLDTSYVKCATYWRANLANGQIDADSSLIECQQFSGGNTFHYNDVNTLAGGHMDNSFSCTFHDIISSDFGGNNNIVHNAIINNEISGNGNTFSKATVAGNFLLNGSNQADSLLFTTPGQSININNGDTMAVNNYLQAGGTCSMLTSIQSTGTGYFSKASGTVTLNYVLLQNISALGGATFIANNSVDGGNVNGITINAPTPQNLYWVGGTGNWDDVNHWATTSGGAGGSCVPNVNDDVFFDANSFASLNDTIYAGAASMYCNNMNWSGITNAPVWYGTINLELHGSLTLDPNMVWEANGTITFQSNAIGNVINSNGVALADTAHLIFCNLIFSGTGSWDLANELNTGNDLFYGSITVSGGSLYTHGYFVKGSSVTIINTANLYLDTSYVKCATYWRANLANGQIDADSSLIECQQFSGGNTFHYNDVNTLAGGHMDNSFSCTFHDIISSDFGGNNNIVHNAIINNEIAGNGNTFNKATVAGNFLLNGSNQADSLLFTTPGQSININNGDTMAVNNYLQAGGTCSMLTSIQSTGTGYFSKASGTVTLNYVLLQNISALGGATFIANNSVDGGNVNGITINAPTPQNLYWVGGTGNWDDVNHWATTSGGAGGSCVPNVNDDVFFDANSFASLNDTIYAGAASMYCNNMNWSGITNAPVWYGTINLELHGSLTLDPNMVWEANGTITFQSNAIGNVINSNGVALADTAHLIFCNLIFSGTGSWDLANELNTGNDLFYGSITVSGGSLYTHGYFVKGSSVTIINTANLYLDTSYVKCAIYWRANLANGQIDADSSLIECQQFSGGNTFHYNDVNTLAGGHMDNSFSCTFHDIISSDFGGNNNIVHNAIINSEIIGNENTFNRLIITDNIIWNGSNEADSLLFIKPGQSVTIFDTDTIHINSFLLIQSDPGFPTSIECNNGTGFISKPTDTVCTDFIYLKNIAATGGAVYFAGDHSVDLGGNTGWNWVRCAPLISNVWPGDCNYDLVTDNFDLLNIGVSFGDTGYVRPAASLSYTAQPCQDWYYQFINAANVKHADCDGNGIVDANDSTAISLNYGLTHPARLVHQDENNSTGTELDFVLPPVIVPGSAVSVPVTLGTSVDPANAVYGIAFTVNYDPAFIQPGTMSVDYGSSWVENAGNHLHLEKDFPVAGKTDIAFTRIDHSDASGYGIIATLNFIASPTANGPFNLSFSHIKVISHNEIEIPIQTGTSTTWVNIDENGNEISSTVFPNPMTDEAQVIFSNPNHETWYFSVQDVTGRIVLAEKTVTANSVLIEKKNLGSGVYFYHLRNIEGKTGKGKVVVE